jgi:hypothetical protein
LVYPFIAVLPRRNLVPLFSGLLFAQLAAGCAVPNLDHDTFITEPAVNSTVTNPPITNTIGCLDDFCYVIAHGSRTQPAIPFWVTFTIGDDNCLYLRESGSDQLFLVAASGAVQFDSDSVNGVMFGELTEVGSLSPTGDIPKEIAERCIYSSVVWVIG